MSIFELVKTGGWAMVPLLICSIAVWAIVAERLYNFKNWKEKNQSFLLTFSNFWLKGEKESALKLCERSSVDLAPVALEFLEASHLSKEKLLSKVERKRLEQSSELKKFLWVLGTIGSASPFIGLFGTVVGIIRSFISMSQSGAGGFAVVSAGISEALVATAAGILVAVIAVFFYNYFQVHVSKMQFQFKLLTEELVDILDK